MATSNAFLRLTAPFCVYLWASQVTSVVKNPPANAGDIREGGSFPELGRSPRRRHGNPLQYSCLENPMDRGAWWATVHGITKSRTWLKRLSTHTHVYLCLPNRLRASWRLPNPILPLSAVAPSAETCIHPEYTRNEQVSGGRSTHGMLMQHMYNQQFSG